MGKMNSFSEKYGYSVDEKGRINFKKILKRLHDDEKANSNYHLLRQTVELYGTKKRYPFFYIFTEKSWKKFYDEKVEGMDTPLRIKFLTAYCGEASLDNSERLAFPKEFLEFAGADKDIVLQGDGEKIQVWSRKNFDEYIKGLSKLTSGTDLEDMFSKHN
jgi:DNA-binding transcriptional regulator/RsmH inhibitor MraZ